MFGVFKKENVSNKVNQIEGTLVNMNQENHIEQPYAFQLFENKLKHPHLLLSGITGFGKTSFLLKLIEHEQKQYLNATSVFFSRDCIIEHANTLRLSDFSFNPFEKFSDGDKVEPKILTLIQSVAKNHQIKWTEQHELVLKEHIQVLLSDSSVEPDLNRLHFSILKKYLIQLKKMSTFITDISNMELTDDQIFEILASSNKELVVNEFPKFPIYQDLVRLLDVFVTEGSVYKKFFNKKTVTPELKGTTVIKLDDKRKHPVEPIVIAFIMDFLLKTKSNENFITIYQDTENLYFDDPCYKYLVENVLKQGKVMQMGVRLSSQTIHPDIPSYYFQSICLFNSLPEDLKKAQELFNLSENECYLVRSLETFECYLVNEKLVLDKEFRGIKIDNTHHQSGTALGGKLGSTELKGEVEAIGRVIG